MKESNQRDRQTGETGQKRPWFVFKDPAALSEKHTGLQARYPHLSGDPTAEGVYEDRGDKFRIGEFEASKDSIGIIAIEQLEELDFPLPIADD